MRSGKLYAAESIETGLLLLHRDALAIGQRALTQWQANRTLRLEELVWHIFTKGQSPSEFRDYIKKDAAQFDEIMNFTYPWFGNASEAKGKKPVDEGTAMDNRIAYIKHVGKRGYKSLGEIMAVMRKVADAAREK